ncbi:MAG: hypothetical protein AAB308_14335, partial [Nitrospirota bacterium]
MVAARELILYNAHRVGAIDAWKGLGMDLSRFMMIVRSLGLSALFMLVAIGALAADNGGAEFA